MSDKPKNVAENRPWKSGEATKRINKKANDEAFSVGLKEHASGQMESRDITMSDVLYVLKNGFVFDEAQPAKEKGWFKYSIEGATPNSGRRNIRVVVIPYPTPAVAIVTVMWVD